jgi:hypothetical protein
MDTSYLTGLLRTELSEAAERVLRSFEKPVGSRQIHLTVNAGKIIG